MEWLKGVLKGPQGLCSTAQVQGQDTRLRRGGGVAGKAAWAAAGPGGWEGVGGLWGNSPPIVSVFLSQVGHQLRARAGEGKLED